MAKTFYTYMWLRSDGSPYYIGKGCERRAFDRRQRTVKPPSRDRVLIQEFSSEEEAYEAERFLISYYGRKDNGTGILWNFTDGGEGGGCTMSEEAKQKISRANKGRKRSDKTKRKISEVRKGIKLSLEHRKRIRDARCGTVQLLETRAKISLAQKAGYSGHKGVSWDKSVNKWAARIKVNNKMVSLGRFVDIQQAVDAFSVAVSKYRGYSLA